MATALIILLSILFIEFFSLSFNLIFFKKKLELYDSIIEKNLNYENMDKVFKNCKDLFNKRYNKKNNLIINLIPFYNVLEYFKAEDFIQKEKENINYKPTLKFKTSSEPLERYSDIVINIHNYKEVNDFNENIDFENLEEEKGYSKIKRRY